MKRYQAIATSPMRAAVILPDGREVWFAVGPNASAECSRTADYMNLFHFGRARFGRQTMEDDAG